MFRCVLTSWIIFFVQLIAHSNGQPIVDNDGMNRSLVSVKNTVDKSYKEVLHVVYFTTRDRSPAKGYQERIDRIMTDIQAFYAKEMKRNGYGDITFPLHRDKSGKIVIHVVRSEEFFDPAKKYSVKEMAPEIVKVLASRGIEASSSHYMVWQNLYWEKDGVWHYDIPYTGSGNRHFSVTWCADHQFLDIDNLKANKTDIIDDRGAKLKICEFNVKMIGGAAHELGHGLGLPHNRATRFESRQFGPALMGAGNYTYGNRRIGKRRDTFITPAHALALACHPLFRQSDKDIDVIPQAYIKNLKCSSDKGRMIVEGKLCSTYPLHGVVIYNDELPTGTNKDYDAQSYAVKVDRKGRFKAEIAPLKETEYALHLVVYFKNGASSRFSGQYKVDAQKVASVQTLSNMINMSLLNTAFANKQSKMFFYYFDKLKSLNPRLVKTKKLQLEVMKEWDEMQSPDKVVPGLKSAYISDMRWTSAECHWFIPSFNQLVEKWGKQCQNFTVLWQNIRKRPGSTRSVKICV